LRIYRQQACTQQLLKCQHKLTWQCKYTGALTFEDAWQAWTQQVEALTTAALRLMTAISSVLTYDATDTEALSYSDLTAVHDRDKVMVNGAVEDAAAFVEAVPRTCDMVAAWHTRMRGMQAAILKKCSQKVLYTVNIPRR
jgi:hypothetical protein